MTGPATLVNVLSVNTGLNRDGHIGGGLADQLDGEVIGGRTLFRDHGRTVGLGDVCHRGGNWNNLKVGIVRSRSCRRVVLVGRTQARGEILGVGGIVAEFTGVLNDPTCNQDVRGAAHVQ